MTSAPRPRNRKLDLPRRRRAQGRERARRHRRLRAKGLGCYDIAVHRERLADVLERLGVPHWNAMGHDVGVAALSEVVALVLNDAQILDRIARLIAARRR
jgi:hypothetical protein